MAHAYEWGIRVVGQAPLRWPDRVVAAPRLTSLVQRGLLVDSPPKAAIQPIAPRCKAPTTWLASAAMPTHHL